METNTDTLQETIEIKFQGATHTCTQLERVENFAIYQRFNEKDELQAFEVFEIRESNKAEIYPGRKRFKANDNAWCFSTESEATEKFDELTTELTVEEPETETVTDTVTRLKDVESNLDRFKIPQGNFTSKEFQALNFKTVKPTSAQVMSSNALKRLSEAGKIIRNGVRPCEGKGRPSNVFVAVSA